MTEGAEKFAIHSDPVWRERANFMIHGELGSADRPYRYEQLWARQLGDDTFEVCCIPFFLYDLALGDVVLTAPRNGRTYVVDRVVQPSGHYTFRAWFGESFQPRDVVADELTALGAVLEWSSRNLLAIDTSNGAHAQTVADYLAKRQQQGDLLYETGRT